MTGREANDPAGQCAPPDFLAGRGTRSRRIVRSRSLERRRSEHDQCRIPDDPRKALRDARHPANIGSTRRARRRSAPNEPNEYEMSASGVFFFFVAPKAESSRAQERAADERKSRMASVSINRSSPPASPREKWKLRKPFSSAKPIESFPLPGKRRSSVKIRHEPDSRSTHGRARAWGPSTLRSARSRGPRAQQNVSS